MISLKQALKRDLIHGYSVASHSRCRSFSKGKISVVLNKSQLNLFDHTLQMLSWTSELVQLSICWAHVLKFALKFFRKDSFLLILREIQTDQNLGFIIYDRHVFLSLLVI